MSEAKAFLAEHNELSRRFFLRAGTTLAAGSSLAASAPARLPPELDPVLKRLESYFTPAIAFGDVSRGRPVPHTLSESKRKEVGLTRTSWKLEIISDPEHRATIGKSFTKTANTAIDFDTLLKLGKKHAVRFAKLMTCLNIGCPLGMGVWEGVPLRGLVWLAKPTANLRRIFYYGYHNDDPKQMFRSSLPVGRVLEDYDGLPPVIACYKLNGQWLTPERGGPVRVVVPEHYGFKCVKWLSHIVLSNISHANDTYANGNNDLDSPMKTFAATLHIPHGAKANAPLAVTGYAQAGISGLAKVQVWISPAGKGVKSDDPYFTTAPWTDATILPPPKQWGGDVNGELLKGAFGFDSEGKPKEWPMRLAKAHWAALLPGQPAGEYILRCRTIDAKGQAQPMPRPFRKGGQCDIESVKFTVAG